MLVDRYYSCEAATSGWDRFGYLPVTELKNATSLIVGEEAAPPITDSDDDGKSSLFDSAVRRIRKSLHGRRVLIVLLDINNIARPDLWQRLMKALRKASMYGSTVIITTTNTALQSTMLIEHHSFSLGGLSEFNSWLLFQEHAYLTLADYVTDLLWVGNICRGHPLSLIILAMKIRCTAMQSILSASSTPPSGDIPRLCSHLKQVYERLIHGGARSPLSPDILRDCFTFLSLFPEDYRFRREEMVDMWAAENSISSDEADSYVEAFVQEGAFVLCEPQDEHDGESTPRRVAYRMPDLLHYFAQHVGSSSAHSTLTPEFFRSPLFRTKGFPSICQHLSCVCDPRSPGFPMDVLLEGSPWLLRTLLLLTASSNEKCEVKDDAEGIEFPTFTLLRVLHVRGITFGKLFRGVGAHCNLVYLNVSHSDTETLPEWIGDLPELRILKLSHCQKLRRLPKSITRLRHLEKLDLEACSLLAGSSLEWVGKLFRLEHLNLSQIDLKSLPGSIGKLSRLKALVLADCQRIRRLPGSIRKLLCLEKLELEGCHFLEELPDNLDSVMKSLKLLNLLRCPSLTRMPLGIGRMPSLKSLPRFMASDELGRSVTELQPLSDLEGELWLDKLDKLVDPEVARQVKLEEKEKLEALTMRWECFDSEEHPEETQQQPQEDVLEALRPNASLRSLKLILYTGKQLPSWMTNEVTYRTSLLDIRLFNLKRCGLPPLGQLPLLKVVKISGMDAVAELDDSFYGETGTFPSLESLTLSQMSNLTGWLMPTEDRHGLFPRLARLTFIQCPKLEPPSYSIPSVTTLTMWMNNEKLYSSADLRNMATNVTKLSVSLCQDLGASSSTCRGFWGLTSLEELQISACQNLTCLPEEMKQLRSLRSLQIIGCSNMKSLPQWLEDLRSLRSISVSACPMLRPAPGGLPSRSRLIIEGCPLLQQR
ncbi:NB-ARC domain [Musa troglodytarum]|uniref:NB-ARC domain n=1 Tax=Musa troglodytarum TaxID=320322 RepID=A0A9E7GIT8_9LILI|nr:NB-ARC domain [Musa troglodytarum]